MQKLHVLVFVQ